MAEPDCVRSKLGKLEEYLRGLDEKKGVSKEEYLEDRDLQDIVERRFEKAIQASIDVASHIVSAEGFREARDYGDLFVVLGEEDVIDEDLDSKMVEMAGFRNVLAHEYSGIDDERVYRHLDNLERFREFARQVHAFVEG